MQPHSNARQKSRCMYCSQLSWGKGCRYAPHGVHFHADVSSLCAYCGNPSYGTGCHVNPTGNIHIHGINYNSMFREQIEGFLHNRVFLKELKKPYTEFKCYKLGIIDGHGNKLRAPITEEEQACFSPMIRTIIKLKKYLGSKIEVLDATNILEKESVPITENIEDYKKLLEFKGRVESNINEPYKILDEAYESGISLEEIQKTIKT